MINAMLPNTTDQILERIRENLLIDRMNACRHWNSGRPKGRMRLSAQMILNHKAAIELLVHEAGQIGFTPHTILNLHALLSDGLLQDPRACGRIRVRVVGIGGSVYHPMALPQRLDELFRIILQMAQEIADRLGQGRLGAMKSGPTSA